MSRPVVDLFDDPPWLPEKANARSPGPHRPLLAAALTMVTLFVLSMALPWFTSSETPPWNPFSRWLDLGWSPGTQKWGFLLLAIALATAIACALAIRRPGRAAMGVLVPLASALLVSTLLELRAHLSVDPGPTLHADYGAWFGAALAVLCWSSVAVSVLVALSGARRVRQPSITSRTPSG